ncbi:MAG: ABC transporter ATP-binding protein [Erysipelotrichaceae bacterium]|nr:ABC transporter ATP-binding protein [Erysipelotrichaceae bacterium]
MPGPRKNLVGQKFVFKKGTLQRFIKDIFKQYGLRLIIVFICIAVSSLASITATVFMRKLIDDVVFPGLDLGLSAVQKDLVNVIITMAGLYLCGLLASFLQGRIMAVVTQGFLRDLRDRMFEKMQKLPIKYFDTHHRGTIMSTYTNDTDAMRQLISNSIPNLAQSILSIVSMAFMMLYYSFWLSLVTAIGIFLLLKIGMKFAMASSKYMVERQKSLAKEEGYIEEMLQGQKVVKVFNHEEEAKKKFDELNLKLCSDSTIANSASNCIGPVTNNLGHIIYVIIAAVGGIMVVTNVTNICLAGVEPITIGIIVSFMSMVRQMSQVFQQISNQIAAVSMGLAGVSRIYELIDEEPEKDEGYVHLVNAKRDENGNLTETKEHTGLWAWKHYHQADDTTTYVELKGDIQMENVDFAYNEDKQILFDISLYAKPGQKIAFVGATGAGKTTITNLINRFYDIPDGKIRYDGININKIAKPDLRKSLGIVLQDVNLFTGTVMDNIRYGRLDATDEECIAAAKLANADDFISRLPNGYKTMLTGNGSQLSQGQRQLISIARAAIADPPVMILDEATSSIDTRTESLVQKGMDNLMKGRTVFVIAHRLSTVRNSNAIMVLDHGHIIERGTHEQLIEQKGTYYQLYTGAFELE